MPISLDAQAGRKALISLQPAWNPTSSVDLANLATFLQSCSANGVRADVILWPLPFSAGLTATQYQAMIAYYGPTVQTYFPLVYHGLAGLGTGGSSATFSSYYPGDAACDKVMVTYTAAAWEAGVTLDAYAAVADGATTPKQFGIAELEANDTTDTAANIAAFFSYTQTFMTTRVANGKNNADVLWYNEIPTTTTTWSSIDTGDALVGLYDTLFDTVTGAGTPPVTVTLSAELDITAGLAAALSGGGGPVPPPPLPPPPPGQPGPPTTGFPAVFVEAGFVAAGASQPPGTFLLGDPGFGVIGTDTLGAGTVWTDIGQFALSGTLARSSTRQQGPLVTYQAGTFTVVLDNTDGRFSPENLTGPYTGAGVSFIRPMVPIRVRALWGGTIYNLFSGYADGWADTTPAGSGPYYAETTLAATDAFKILANMIRPGQAVLDGGGEDTGARINRILDSAGWSPTDRLISAGDTFLQGTYLAGDPLSEMQLAADTELGDLYVNGEGRVVFRHRQATVEETRSAVVQAVFGDHPGDPVTSPLAVTLPDTYTDPYADAFGGGVTAGGSGVYNSGYDTTYPGTASGVFTGFFELAYGSVGRANDDTQLVNDVQITRAITDTTSTITPALQEYTDQDSVAEFLFPRSYSRTDLILLSDTEAGDYARYVVNLARGGENRFDTLDVDPIGDPEGQWPQVLGRELGDRIQVWRRPPGQAAAITKDSFIRGITHTFDTSTGTWDTTWALQDAARYAFTVVGDNKFGVLGQYPLGY